MKPLRITFLFFLSFFFISCSGIKTDIFINEDGSGIYKLRLDMGEMMSKVTSTMDNIMSDSLSSYENLEEGNDKDVYGVDGESEDMTYSYDENIDTSSNENIWTEMDSTEMDDLWMEKDNNESEDYVFESSSTTFGDDQIVEKPKTMMQLKMMALMEAENMDTTINAFDMIPDTVLSRLQDAHLLKNISLKVVTNKSEEKASMDFALKFKQIQELKQIMDVMSNAQFLETGDTTGMGGLETNLATMDHIKIDPKGRQIIIEEFSMENDPNFSEGDINAFSDMSDEDLSKTLSMFGIEDLFIIYHLPAKVKQVKGSVDYKILEDNRVEIKIPMVKMIKTKVSPGYTIKY